VATAGWFSQVPKVSEFTMVVSAVGITSEEVLPRRRWSRPDGPVRPRWRL